MKLVFKSLVALASISVTIFVGLYVYQYALHLSKNTGPAPEPQPMAVETTTPLRHAVEDRANLVGILEAGAQFQLVARTSGYIVELPFDVGDTIRAGEVIVKLDDSQQRENVAAARAALTIAEAQLKSQQAQVNLAQKVVERERRLANANATTAEQLDAAEGQLEVGMAQLELERARVSEALSRLEQSQLLLKEMQILAPTTGVVAERFVDVGDLAKNDVPLMRIVKIDTVRTLVHVIEHDYPKITNGQVATIETDAFTGRAFHGRVVRKAPIIDPTTGTAAVQIEIPNGELLLKPGMHTRASILFQRRDNVMVVPASALLENHRLPAVMVVSGNPPTAELREVEIGVNNGEIVEIVSGIAADEHVVTLGSRMISVGQQVRPIASSWSGEMIVSDNQGASMNPVPVAAE